MSYSKGQKTAIAICSVLFTASVAFEIYAMLAPGSHTVEFITHNSTEIAPIKVRHGQHVPYPEVELTKLGYDLRGFTTDEGTWNFQKDKVTKDIVLEANWTTVKYKINYNLNTSHSAYVDPDFKWVYTIESNFDLDQAHCGDGYLQFAGWYYDPVVKGERIDHIYPGQTGEITIYAHWDLRSYNLRLVSEYSYAPIGNIQIYPGQEVIVPAPEAPEGKEFYYWESNWYEYRTYYPEADGTVKFTPTITGDYQFVAHFREL